MQFDYVLRRSNGYFVYSTTGSGSGQQEPTKFARNYQEEPVTLAVGKGVLIKGEREFSHASIKHQSVQGPSYHIASHTMTITQHVPLLHI